MVSYLAMILVKLNWWIRLDYTESIENIPCRHFSAISSVSRMMVFLILLDIDMTIISMSMTIRIKSDSEFIGKLSCGPNHIKSTLQ